LIQGFLLEAGLSRGDLSEAEWRVLKGLLPIDAANRGRGRVRSIIVQLLTAYFGASAAARHGLMFRQNMGTGTQFTAGSDAGGKPGSGKMAR